MLPVYHGLCNCKKKENHFVNFKPFTRSIEIVPLNSGNTAWIYSSIEKSLETVTLNFEKLQPTAQLSLCKF